MKRDHRTAAVFAAVFLMSGILAPCTAKAEQPGETTVPAEAPAAEETGSPIPDEAPAFHARIEFRMGYTVIGTFTDFTPDITLIQPLYSLDEENWQTSSVIWNLYTLGTDREDLLPGLQNQPCLFDIHEPLKSYIAGKTDRFYLKLRITRKDGPSYETQTAVIDRGSPRPVPEGAERRALFSSEIAVTESSTDSPYCYRSYGCCQFTVSADADAEEISALLPETLPVEVQLDHGPDFIAIGIVDCPVTWKPLSLPRLTAGESITIPDAAEEIRIPGGTLVSTPVGTFQLEEPLGLDTLPSTDEVRLVLNVSPAEGKPAGVLRAGKNGLEMAFQQKPTGAASIQAYIWTEKESKWTELSGLSLPEELNQPSTANSGYALLLRNDQEPYRSFLAAEASGDVPAPFLIGLKIKGGIYDGQQLILPWPDTYQQLPDLPEVGGAGGNEGNAGSDDKADSTEHGQRPNLPPEACEEQELQPEASEEQEQNLPPNPPASASEAPADAGAGQRSETPLPAVPDTAGPPPAEQPGSGNPTDSPMSEGSGTSSQVPLIVQAAADRRSKDVCPALPEEKVYAERRKRIDPWISFLPAAAAVCLGAAACKIKISRRPRKTAGKIRSIFRR